MKVYAKTACAFFTLICGCASLCFAGESLALVKRTSGSVSVRIGQAPAWKTCASAMKLKECDAIRTMKKADCDIIMPDSSVLRLDEKTMLEFLTLRNFGAGVLSTKMKLSSGAAVLQLKNPLSLESVVELELPTATVLLYSGVIGFDVSDERSVVKVYSGKAVVTPAGSAAGVTMTDNQKTAVAKGQMRVIVENENADKKESETPAPDTLKTADKAVLDTEECK